MWDTMNVDGEFVSLQLLGLGRFSPRAASVSDRLKLDSLSGAGRNLDE